MLIRSEDFGPIKKYKKVWFTCEECGIGVLQLYKNYLNQKDKKLCRSCRNKYSLSQPEAKEKMKNRLKKQWQDIGYRKKMTNSLSKGCKKAWDKDDGTRRKLVSENTSKGLKKKWQDPEFKKQQSKIQKEIQNRKQVKDKKGKTLKKLWNDPIYRKKNIESRKGKPAHNKHPYEYIKEFFEKHGYKLLSKKYKNANTKLKVKCPDNHIIKISYGNLREGHGCPFCSKSKQFSYHEKEIGNYVKSLNLDIIENDRKIIYPLELDIVIPFKKIAIEYCGLYWHSNNFLKRNYHLNKLNLCNEKGYKLITIFEDEWINKKNIVKTRLKHILGLNNKKIYARKCEIKEINKNITKNFIDKHHIQGYNSGTINLGGFYKNKLVAIKTFIRRDINKKIWEINRFCLGKYNVIGIASKLLKYFQRNYEWNEIITFADRRWSEGNLYEKIGFEKEYIIGTNYWYFNNTSEIKRFHKFSFRRKSLAKKLLNFDPNLSEWENMKANGWNRIWDCGNIKYILKNC